MNLENWGPWIDHDGRGCPCIGQMVNVEWVDGEFTSGIAGSASGMGWDWGKMPLMHVVRYRVRKPRELTKMIRRVKNLPEPSKQKVTA